MTSLPEVDTDYLRDHLAALLAIPSPTGHTDEAVRYVCGALQAMGLEFALTRLGAIRAKLPGAQSEGARACVSHVDTLGAQVKALKANGRLALVPVGHWSARFAEGARATILTASGPLRGTILPPLASGHTFGDEVDKAPIGWDHVEMRVDAKADSQEELEALGIEIGDHVAVDPQPEFMDNGYIVSRHLDDKG